MTAPVPYATHLRRIADAVARAIANEREACAELCENNTVVNTAAASADLAEAVRALTKAIVTARRFRAPDCDDETTIIPTPKWDAIMSAHMDAVAALSRLDAAGGGA